MKKESQARGWRKLHPSYFAPRQSERGMQRAVDLRINPGRYECGPQVGCPSGRGRFAIEERETVAIRAIRASCLPQIQGKLRRGSGHTAVFNATAAIARRGRQAFRTLVARAFGLEPTDPSINGIGSAGRNRGRTRRRAGQERWPHWQTCSRLEQLQRWDGQESRCSPSGPCVRSRLL